MKSNPLLSRWRSNTAPPRHGGLKITLLQSKITKFTWTNNVAPSAEFHVNTSSCKVICPSVSLSCNSYIISRRELLKSMCSGDCDTNSLWDWFMRIIAWKYHISWHTYDFIVVHRQGPVTVNAMVVNSIFV